MNLLQIDPVKDSLEVSRAISELGIMIVLSGVMIIMFIALIIYFFRTNQENNKKIRESLQNLENINTELKAVLAEIAESKSEESLIMQTEYNTEKLISSSFNEFKDDIIHGTIDILTYNHINDRPFTEDRVRNLIIRANNSRIEWLNTFKSHKGSRLSDFANSSKWVDVLFEIIINYIYTDNRQPKVLYRDLSLKIDELKNEIDF